MYCKWRACPYEHLPHISLLSRQDIPHMLHITSYVRSMTLFHTLHDITSYISNMMAAYIHNMMCHAQSYVSLYLTLQHMYVSDVSWKEGRMCVKEQIYIDLFKMFFTNNQLIVTFKHRNLEM